MISLNKVSVFFGGQTLFEDISFMINTGDRIGLVGKNGAGKTTLLKLMANEEKPNSGHVSKSKNLKIGYLKQELEFKDGLTVLEEAESVFTEIKEIENEITQLKTKLDDLANNNDASSFDMTNRINELNEAFLFHDGYSLNSKLSKVLLGLGFLQSDFEKQTNTFSGGWRMRIELAKILLQQPDVLLLDEPTNHLDIESIMWLEQWLKNYSGSVVLVSHDRTFLDAVTNRTIELSLGKIYDYKAPYSKYVQLRMERQVIQTQEKKNQEKYIKHTGQLIEKFRYKKSKAAFAQSLIKKLDKLERIEVDSDDTSAIHFRFPPAPHSGKISFKASRVYKNYDELQVLENVSLEVKKGEKIAFVGRNGEGKTTLAKIIADHLDFKGDLELGHLVKVGYYAQNQSDLLENNLTVLKTIEDAANQETSSKVRNILGSFLFSGDTVSKKIKVLSGGEKARVALCKLLLEPVNLLVMDEPTNHLDMKSKDILKQALINYNGSLIIVSHDRDFLHGLTSKVYEFKNRKIKEYIGDITAFLEAHHVADLSQLELKPVGASKNQGKIQKQPSDNKINFERKKQLQRDLRKASNKAGKLERQIDELEKNIKKLDEQLADPVQFKELSVKPGFFDDYQKKQNQLSELMQNWEQAQEKLDRLSEFQTKQST